MPPISDAPAATAAPASSASSASSADGTVAPPMDDRIRGDVHLLGELLGQVLRESGDDSLYTDVERLRALTIGAYDSGHPDELAAAEEFVASLTAERAEEVMVTQGLREYGVEHEQGVAAAVAHATVDTAVALNAAAIITPTMSSSAAEPSTR